MGKKMWKLDQMIKFSVQKPKELLDTCMHIPAYTLLQVGLFVSFAGVKHLMGPTSGGRALRSDHPGTKVFGLS